jgi:purine-binding chemotaxis protein CheW
MLEGSYGAAERHAQAGGSGTTGTLSVAFAAAGRRWALPLAAVERVVAMVAVSELAGAPAAIRGAIDVHGEIVPVLDLGLRLGDLPHPLNAEAQLVLARTPRRAVALPVDEALGVVALTLGAASGPLAGVAAPGDELLAVYDLDAFLSAGEEDELTLALAEAGR